LFRPKNKLLIHFHMDVSSLGFFQRLLAFPDKLLRSKLFALADGITCASLDYVKTSSLSAVYESRPERFHELPFLVDTEKFYPRSPVEKKNVPTILFVGGMDAPHHFKGVDILLRAFSELKTIARLRLVGDGSLRPGYEALAHKLGLADRVEFLGALDDLALAKVYRESDIFVLPSVSRHEAFGIVLLEAMASGLAVVASDLPGVRTVFRAAQEGFFFPPADSRALGQILERLLTQPELRRTLSQNARALALARYDSRQQAERLDRLVRSL
jgi:glycosyltransferase involved in cell wall biosynthesis